MNSCRFPAISTPNPHRWVSISTNKNEINKIQWEIRTRGGWFDDEISSLQRFFEFTSSPLPPPPPPPSDSLVLVELSVASIGGGDQGTTWLSSISTAVSSSSPLFSPQILRFTHCGQRETAGPTLPPETDDDVDDWQTWQSSFLEWRATRKLAECTAASQCQHKLASSDSQCTVAILSHNSHAFFILPTRTTVWYILEMENNFLFEMIDEDVMKSNWTEEIIGERKAKEEERKHNIFF